MKSKWHEFKPEALRLRKCGYSIPSIEATLGIPRSTLSGWFKNVVLTSKQKQRLHNNWKRALVTARGEAVKWHNRQKEMRMHVAKQEALAVLQKIDTSDIHLLEIALAILYLAEGSKKNTETALGSSDPLTLRFFVTTLTRIYDFDTSKIRCELYLRADQDVGKIKRFWSRELALPISSFQQVNIDARSLGKPTFNDYHGVCALRCGHVAIQRRLVYLARAFFDTIAHP